MGWLFKTNRRQNKKHKASCLLVLSVFEDQELRDATRREEAAESYLFYF